MKGKDCYDLNCIDHVTKYITAHTLVEKRTKQACVSFLSQIKQTCYNQILTRYYCEKYRRIKDGKLITFVSDGFWNYRTAFNKLFYRIATLQFGVPIACKKYGLEHNNNPIERYNGKLKDRLKVIRGGFGSFEYAKAFMNLRHIIHNFVNPHQQLQGKTPAEKAEIKLSLGRMKLYNLIRYLANRLDDD